MHFHFENETNRKHVMNIAVLLSLPKIANSSFPYQNTLPPHPDQHNNANGIDAHARHRRSIKEAGTLRGLFGCGVRVFPGHVSTFCTSGRWETTL